MKFSLFFLLSAVSFIGFGQCDEYYINSLVSGQSNNVFPSGAPIRFCPGLKGVSLNGYTFDTYQWSGISTQNITLSKNGGIAGTLVLSLYSRELKVNLNGSSGVQVYSISLSKSEYAEFNSRIELKNKEDDAITSTKINEALKRGDFFEANSLYSRLNYKIPELRSNIDKEWVPFKAELDLLYKEYCAQFEQIESQLLADYLTDEVGFLQKYKNSILTSEFKWGGKSDYEKIIQLSKDEGIIESSNWTLDNNAVIYDKIDNKHYIAMVSAFNNMNFDNAKIDSIEIRIAISNITNKPFPMIVNSFKGEEVSVNLVVNPTTFLTSNYLFPYPETLSEKIKFILNQGGEDYIATHYPEKLIFLESSEKIPFISTVLSKPQEGVKNDKYLELDGIIKNNFGSLIHGYYLKGRTMAGGMVYNPKLMYLLKKVYEKNNIDSVFVIIDESDVLSNLDRTQALTLASQSKRKSCYFIPIVKGKTAYDHGTLRFFKLNGDYTEYSMKSAVFSDVLELKKIKTDSIDLTSQFTSKVLETRGDDEIRLTNDGYKYIKNVFVGVKVEKEKSKVSGGIVICEKCENPFDFQYAYLEGQRTISDPTFYFTQNLVISRYKVVSPEDAINKDDFYFAFKTLKTSNGNSWEGHWQEEIWESAIGKIMICELIKNLNKGDFKSADNFIFYFNYAMMKDKYLSTN
jgi:hypothetical protein